MFSNIESFLFTSDLLAHSFFVNDHAAQPEVWLTVLFIIGIHLYGKSLQAFLVTHIDCLLLGNMLLQMGYLVTDNTCNYIAHAIVVTKLLMLIPCRTFSGLC